MLRRMTKIIEKIKEENLLGRSGSMFPVGEKWEMVKKSLGDKKYVICNASEGEIDTFKDYFILKNYLEDVIKGIEIAVSELEADKAFIYLNKKYFPEFAESLSREGIEVVEKKGGYIGGEETSVIEAIEGKRPEPRIKPPFPSEKGLWGCPTLVNNVETFYCVAKIYSGEYKRTRFFSIGGDAPNRGVFEFSEDVTVKKLLEETDNIPSFDYFMQIGGGAGGQIILPSETDRKFDCLGSLIIYNREETDPLVLMKKWAEFLLDENCDKCTPCREGLYRIEEMVEKRDFQEIEDMFFVMINTSLCPLGRIATNPFKSLLDKIIFEKNGDNN